MVKPVEVIGKAHRRLALIAAAHDTTLYAVPALTAFMLAALFNVLGAATWERAGYVMSAPHLFAIRMALLACGVMALGVGAWRGWRAFSHSGFVDAGGRVDQAVDGHDEVLTLAVLSDPAAPDTEERSPLVPLLWRRVMTLLASFDPERAFRFELGAPLRRSSIFALALVVVLALATLALVRLPTPEEVVAHRLVELAHAIEQTPGGKQLAEKILTAAKALENSDLPPEEKRSQLDDLMQQVRHIEQQRQQQMAQSGKGESGKGSGNATGQGTEASGNGKSSGNGAEGAGEGTGKSSDKNAGAESGKGGQKQNSQMAELQNELAKAQAQIEAKGAKNPEPKPQAGENRTGNAPKQGQKPGQNQLVNKGQSAGAKINQPGTSEQPRKPGQGSGVGSGNALGGNQGDTHLGEMPPPVRFARFYQPGETGPKLQIHDARYVLFRLPDAQPSQAGGKLTRDPSSPRAKTAYVNVPLSESKPADVSPNEQQLVPPRYRELIR